MKTLFAIKASTLACFIFFSAHAQSAMVVKQIKGSAFMVLDSKTQSLHTGDHIPAGAEVLTETNSELTLANYYNHQFHITGPGHIKVDKKNTLLYEGYLWFRAISIGRGGVQSFTIQTANSMIQYNDTDGIISFDPQKSKTQFLGLRGKGTFFNKNQPGLRPEITSGMFSFIHSDHNKGVPSDPSPIGLQSYRKLAILFDGIRRLPLVPGIQDKMQSLGRGIASVEGDKYNIQNMPHFLNSPTTPAPTQTGPAPIQINFYVPSSFLNTNRDSDKLGKDAPPLPEIKISKKKSPGRQSKGGRAPASLPYAPGSNPFEQALQSRYKERMHRNKDINTLIDALKSVNKDYPKNY